jgi:hypothetical protein
MNQHRGRHLRHVIPVVVVAVLAGCAGSEGDAGAVRRTTTSLPTAPAPAEHPCAWPTRADRSIDNIAYPDTAATYWGQGYRLADGETLELEGSFPDARYASFITYRTTGGAIDTLTDRDIAPDDGSTNPFAGGSAEGPHDYTVTVRPDRGADASGNDLGAAAADDGPAPDPVPLTDEVEALVRRDQAGSGGDDATVGTILYRLYLPNDEDDVTGGVGLPRVTVVGADGTRTELPPCPDPTTSAAGKATVEHFGPETDRPAPPAPVFIRPDGAQARLYPNPDNVYVATIVEHQPGRLVVVRGKAPTFPDTRTGPVGQGEQVRYWSMCTNEFRKPYPVTTCAADVDVALSDDGSFTFVVSTPEDRPDNATPEDGVTWLDWGSTEVNGLLLLRHMLASPDFAESAINLEPGQVAQEVMGPYTPLGAYCTTEQFETDDPACTAG